MSHGLVKAPAPREVINSSVRSGGSPSCTRGSILLICSDAFRGRYLGEILQGAGHPVAITSDVQTALEFLLDDAGLAVLIGSLPDWRIERLCEVCLTLRRIAPSLPLIVVGPNDVDAKIKLFKLGSDDYVVEPFDVTEFLARINSWIRRRCASW